MYFAQCSTLGVEDLAMVTGDEINSKKSYLVIFNGLILGVHRRPLVWIMLFVIFLDYSILCLHGLVCYDVSIVVCKHAKASSKGR